jgi:hypothetical protein
MPHRRDPRRWHTALLAAVSCAALDGCGPPPPASRFPDAEAAIERMVSTFACSRGIQGEAQIDYFGDQGRGRGSVLFKVELPDRIRFDVYSPFGVTLATLTSDGRKFSLFDMRNKSFLFGPASTCNLARFTQVPVPPHALAQLLRGEAPVLVHEAGAARIEWESSWFGDGQYVVTIPSRYAAFETITLVPRPQDWGVPWQEQRLRVLSVEVRQESMALYRATLADHRAAHTAEPQVDPDFPGVSVGPSGPPCDAEVPRRIRLEVPNGDQDLVIVNKEVVHNPPFGPGSFEQPVPGGVKVRHVECGR